MRALRNKETGIISCITNSREGLAFLIKRKRNNLPTPHGMTRSQFEKSFKEEYECVILDIIPEPWCEQP